MTPDGDKKTLLEKFSEKVMENRRIKFKGKPVETEGHACYSIIVHIGSVIPIARDDTGTDTSIIQAKMLRKVF